MKSVLLLSLAMTLVSCASNFNKKKPLVTQKVLGESIFRQDGKVTNKLQVFDQIGSSQKEIDELSEIKKDYVLALVGAGTGGALISFGVIDKNGMSKVLVGGLLAGLGYYFGIRADEKLAPYVEKHNKKTSSHTPQFLIEPSGESVALGLGYNFTY